MKTVEYGSSPASAYHVTGSHGISIPSSAILDSALSLALLSSFEDFTPLQTPFTHGRRTFLQCQPTANLRLPPRSPAPASQAKACGKFLASWDNHPLCTSCRRTSPEPCLGIFVCPTCVDWSEEQRLQFNNRHTYRKKVPSSLPSDLGNLLVVDCATDPVPTEPVTSPPPSQSTDSTPTVPAQHTLESLLVGLSTQLSSLTASLRGEKGGARVHALLHRCRTGHPWPPAPTRHRQTMNTCHLSPAVSQTSETGAALHLRPTHYSCTSHGTAPSATHRSPIAAPGAAHVPLHNTHGPSRAAPTTATWIHSDPATATVSHAHPARDGAATPPHDSQITAMRQPRGASNITTTAAALLTVTFPIDPAGATSCTCDQILSLQLP